MHCVSGAVPPPGRERKEEKVYTGGQKLQLLIALR